MQQRIAAEREVKLKLFKSSGKEGELEGLRRQNERRRREEGSLAKRMAEF